MFERVILGICWLLVCASFTYQASAQPTADDIGLLKQLDKQPEFKGGIKALSRFIRKNFHPSVEAINANISGTVHVDFILTEEGRITNVVSLLPISYGIDEEGARVVKLMEGYWLPAIKDGKPVAVHWAVPIKFGTR